MIERRIFLKNGALSMVGLPMLPGFLYRAVMAASPEETKKKVLVVVFQRGGVDGLNMIVPFGDKDYYSHRPTIAIKQPSKEDSEAALDLDGFYGLHPSLKPLESIYKENKLAIIHATGSPLSTRSHFQAQDYMESAAPGNRSVGSGWLNRYLGSNPVDGASTFRGTSLGSVLPRTLELSEVSPEFRVSPEFPSGTIRNTSGFS